MSDQAIAVQSAAVIAQGAEDVVSERAGAALSPVSVLVGEALYLGFAKGQPQRRGFTVEHVCPELFDAINKLSCEDHDRYLGTVMARTHI